MSDRYRIEHLAKRVSRLGSGYQGMDDQSAIVAELNALAGSIANPPAPSGDETYFDLDKDQLIYKGEAMVPASEVERLKAELSEVQACAESWMRDYDALKEKYEPMILVTSDVKVAEAVRAERDRAEVILERMREEFISGEPFLKNLANAKYALKNPTEKP